MWQETHVVEPEDQPVQASQGPSERRAGPPGQPAALLSRGHLQAGQALRAAPQCVLPAGQELLPR